MRRAIALLFALALAACQTGPEGFSSPGPSAPPPPAGVITGRGVFHLRNGGRGSCEGLSIALMRDTPSFRDRVARLYGSTESASLPIATVKARSARLGSS